MIYEAAGNVQEDPERDYRYTGEEDPGPIWEEANI